CERCPSCCACRTCSSCNRRQPEDDSDCERCGKCERCCSCCLCDNCDNRVDSDDYCSDCCRCNNCCSCNSKEECPIPGGFFDPSDKHHVGKPCPGNPTKRKLAVEIEVSSTNGDLDELVRIVRKYGGGIIYDGSLPDNTGFEINTAPASGEAFV